MSTYKLILVDEAYIELKSLLSAVKGLPIGIVFAQLPGGEVIRVVDTGITVTKKK